jgi:hypothetical protein
MVSVAEQRDPRSGRPELPRNSGEVGAFRTRYRWDLNSNMDPGSAWNLFKIRGYSGFLTHPEAVRMIRITLSCGQEVGKPYRLQVEDERLSVPIMTSHCSE